MVPHRQTHTDRQRGYDDDSIDVRILPFNDKLCSEYYFFLSFFFQSQVLILLNVSLLEGDCEINTVTEGVNASGQQVL